MKWDSEKISNRAYFAGLLLLILSTQFMMLNVYDVISSVISLPMDVDSLSATGTTLFSAIQIIGGALTIGGILIVHRSKQKQTEDR